MIFTVHQAQNRGIRFEGNPDNWKNRKPGDYAIVCQVDCSTLEEMWTLTQHVNEPWHLSNAFMSARGRVLAASPHVPLRSTSVGDVIVDSSGNAFMCMAVGYTKVEGTSDA